MSGPTKSTTEGSPDVPRERPILFSAPMVRAILAGTKTQTRRVVKPMAGLQRTWLTPELLQKVPAVHMVLPGNASGVPFGVSLNHPLGGPLGYIRSPYGVPGDMLWVRESWCAADTPSGFAYMADAPGDPRGLGWRPSIHMPRRASRITLRITDVRVERLNDISEPDALAEGLEPRDGGWWGVGTLSGTSPRATYAVLWEQINGPGSWAANPWVWAVSFERIEC